MCKSKELISYPLELKKVMPHLLELIEKGEVKVFDHGCERELNETEGNRIKEIESDEDCKETVVAVIIDDSMLGPDVVTMTSYLIISKDMQPIRTKDGVIFYSFVVNPDWDVEEYGDVIVLEKGNIICRIG